MAGDLGSLVLSMQMDLARWESDLGRANHIAERNAKSMERAFDGFKNLLGGLGIAEFTREMVNSAKEAEQSEARLTAVLKAQGDVAGITRAQLNQMADDMAANTQFTDEAVRNSEATLLKFGNIQEDVYRRALRISGDYAAFVGSDMPAAAQVLGRALAAPSEAVGTLERQLGKLTLAQRDTIEGFIASNNMAGAQAAILDVVQAKIGGTAEIMNTGYTRAIGGAKKSWDEFLESLGRSPVVSGLAGAGLYLIEKSLAGIKDVIDSINMETFEKVITLRFKKEDTSDPAAEGAARAAAAEARWQAMMDKEMVEQRKMVAQMEKQQADARRKAAQDFAREQEQLRAKGVRSEEAAAEARFNAANDAYIAQGQLDLKALNARKAQAESLEREAEAYRQLADPTRKFFEQQQRIAELVQSGQLDPEEADIAWFKLQQQIVAAQGNVIEFKEKGKEAKDELVQAFEGWGRSVSKDFADMVVTADYGFDKIRKSAQNLLRDIIAMQINKRMVQPIIAAGSGFLDKIIEGAGGSIGSWFKSGGGAGDPNQVANMEAASQAFALDSFATGTDYVPQTGLYQLHKGEAVVPSSANGGAANGPVFQVDMRGASVEAVQRLERLVMQVNGTLESRALAAVTNAAGRSRSFARALSGG